ncbi:hypothetical protein ON058_01225 [Demequina sp. B12]|uniref:LppM family (lipo)protein n=1 Tax=Demequina sp. B12 TaxID=2992757 RepID=UPI00237B8EB3|nr:hypothetical protein [Demequina sp. B12]MDE0572033.1 hypothetical protein [Demequina sp. B12]
MTRALARAFASASILLALTGCVRATADTTFGEDGTFSQTAIVAYSDSVSGELADVIGMDPGVLIGGIEDSPEFRAFHEEYPDQVTISDYDDGDLAGIQLELTDIPIDAFDEASTQALGTLGASATVALEDGRYTVSFLRTGQDAAQLLALGSSQLELLGSSVDVEVTFTFPGPVTSATAGEISGNTVTIGFADLATTPEIRIVADAESVFPWAALGTWAAVVGAFALVIGGAAALVIQDKRARARNSLPPPQAAPEATGPGVLKPPSAASPSGKDST